MKTDKTSVSPVVTIDKSLNKLSRKVIFKAKLARANALLKSVSPPQGAQ